MSVSEQESGIVDTHIVALQDTAASENTFIFVRPTEFDSTILIRAGYATKSMDVHHKSSNWGPMAGFVPCDPAFSKKCEGKPNSNENEHEHLDAHPVQLALKDSLLNNHQKIEFTTDFVLAPAPPFDTKSQPAPVRTPKWTVKRKVVSGSVKDKVAHFGAGQQMSHIPKHKFCLAKPSDMGNKSTLFCLIEEKAGEWQVNWTKWEGETGWLYPLRAFAYKQNGKLNPVTGDYDLWMVAPHFKHFDKHRVVQLETDTHGSSAASGFTMGLITTMNVRCGRANNPVFNHGAEAQNYGFTQALDWNLAMFTPGGESRMVRMNQMPGILADLQQAGYLVVWNARYGESDPRLMGAADKRGGKKMGEIQRELDKLFSELDEIRKTANPGAVASQFQNSVSTGTPMMPGAMKNELSKMADRFSATRNLGTEQSRIYRFNRQLLDFMDSQAAGFRVLSANDFHSTFRVYNVELRRLHKELQQAMVGATGGSGESQTLKLELWLKVNGSKIDSLKQYWV